MSISAETLRDARNRASLTQTELAEKLGVSSRTVVNWERTGVPARSEFLVASVLDIVKQGGVWRVDEDVPAANEAVPSVVPLRGFENSKVSIVFEGRASQDPSRQAVVKQVIAAMELAEWASEYNVDPVYLAEMLEALINIVMNTGLASEQVFEQGDLLAWVLQRSESLLDEHLENYKYEPSRTFARVSFKSYIDELAEKRREQSEMSGTYLHSDYEPVVDQGRFPQGPADVGSPSDDEVPENVEEEWGLAAHPKTDLPQDHTP